MSFSGTTLIQSLTPEPSLHLSRDGIQRSVFPGFYYCVVDVDPSDTAQSMIEMKSINQAHLPLMDAQIFPQPLTNCINKL
jgi:hypothetical protein